MNIKMAVNEMAGNIYIGSESSSLLKDYVIRNKNAANCQKRNRVIMRH